MRLRFTINRSSKNAGAVRYVLAIEAIVGTVVSSPNLTIPCLTFASRPITSNEWSYRGWQLAMTNSTSKE